mgnify:CR=1 FL=1
MKTAQTTEELKKKLGTNFVRVIPSYLYGPKPKPHSRRDLWRLAVKERKK